jgi:hypothetical protein
MFTHRLHSVLAWLATKPTVQRDAEVVERIIGISGPAQVSIPFFLANVAYGALCFDAQTACDRQTKLIEAFELVPIP